MTKKKEKVAKKKEELMVPRDLTLESYKNPDDIHVVYKWRMEAKCIDAPAIRRIYKPPQRDVFLDYLEFKMNQKSTLFEMIFGKRLL